MKAIKISYRSARSLLTFLDTIPELIVDHPNDAADELRKALAVKPAVRERKKLKAAKKAEKRDETAEIRAAVVKRADGRCECGCDTFVTEETGELDHFFGRGKVRQTERNTWLLSRECHRAKTNNSPSRAAWLNRFIAHCDRHRFTSEAWHAETLRKTVEAKERLRHVSQVDLVGDGLGARTWRRLQDQQAKGGE